MLILCVWQDFAVEPDDQRMRKAAHLMVGSLAGSLALVTCRDPLRTSLTNRLRSLLAQGLDAAMLEQYVQVRTHAFCHTKFSACQYGQVWTIPSVRHSLLLLAHLSRWEYVPLPYQVQYCLFCMHVASDHSG